MLTLYRRPECLAADEIEAELRELRLAHRVVRLSDSDQPADPASDLHELPLLEDGDQSYAGQQAIRAHVHRMAVLKDRWQKHGADACYCDDDGEVL